MSAHPGSNAMRVQPSIIKDSRTLAFSGPSISFLSDWCTPAMTSWAAANESAHRAWVDLAAEWQGFVGRRLCRICRDRQIRRRFYSARHWRGHRQPVAD